MASSAGPTPNLNKRRATRKFHTTPIEARTGEDDNVSKGSTEAFVGGITVVKSKIIPKLITAITAEFIPNRLTPLYSEIYYKEEKDI